VVDDAVRMLEPGLALVDLLGDDGTRLAEAAERAHQSPTQIFALSEVRLRPPIPQPPSVRDFSSFEEHVRSGLRAIGQELGADWYTAPVFYFGNANNFIGSDDVAHVPGNSEKMDFELEVAAVIGREGIDLDPDEADQHIAGYCIFNDWSARDLQTRETATAPIGPAKGKDFANSLGPYLVTPDEIEPFRKGKAFDLGMRAWVNDRQVSEGNWAGIYWSFGEMLAYASRSARLVPGDVVGAGTCASGCILELSARYGDVQYPWLVDGDKVVLEIEGLGRLANTVAFGSQPKPLR
jgi:2-keto-4-pentenoate hydratase/2-oxohepta-3-ene-1,7-dioic acid hydratase in catechol pathway